MRTVENMSAGNSGKRWVATWQETGEPVTTAGGKRTVIRCGTREAENIERDYGMYLTEANPTTGKE